MSASSAIFDMTPTDLSVASPELLTREINAVRPGVTLYSGYPQWRKIQVFGGFVWFPPDLPGHPVTFHPWERDKNGERVAYAADGRLQIKDRIGWIYPPVAMGGSRGAPSYGAVPGQDILAQVRFIVRKFPYIVWLRGDKTDAPQIARARNEAAKARMTWAAMSMARRRKTVEDAKRQGTIPPPPSATQREAQRILDTGTDGGAYKEFVCTYFDGDYDTWEELRDHMLKTHQETLKPPVNASVAETPLRES